MTVYKCPVCWLPSTSLAPGHVQRCKKEARGVVSGSPAATTTIDNRGGGDPDTLRKVADMSEGPAFEFDQRDLRGPWSALRTPATDRYRFRLGPEVDMYGTIPETIERLEAIVACLRNLAVVEAVNPPATGSTVLKDWKGEGS